MDIKLQILGITLIPLGLFFLTYDPNLPSYGIGIFGPIIWLFGLILFITGLIILVYGTFKKSE